MEDKRPGNLLGSFVEGTAVGAMALSVTAFLGLTAASLVQNTLPFNIASVAPQLLLAIAIGAVSAGAIKTVFSAFESGAKSLGETRGLNGQVQGQGRSQNTQQPAQGRIVTERDKFLKENVELNPYLENEGIGASLPGRYQQQEIGKVAAHR